MESASALGSLTSNVKSDNDSSHESSPEESPMHGSPSFLADAKSSEQSRGPQKFVSKGDNNNDSFGPVR